MSTDGNPITDQTQTKKADNVPETKAAQTSPVKLSGWKRLRNKLGLKGSNPKPPTPSPSPPQSPPKVDASPRLLELIKGDLKEMLNEARELNNYNNRLNDDLQILQSVFQEIKLGREETLKKKSMEETLKKFRNELMKVKLTIPSNIGAHKAKQLTPQFIMERISGEEPKKIPLLHRSSLFMTSMEFKDFQDRYDRLEDNNLKLCLLCLSIFPQGAVIKKRLMLQWWVVEGFASDEEVAEDYLKELMDRGFLIEAAPGENSCRLHPFHRSVLVKLAERARVFNFGKEGGPIQSFKGTFQACLSGSGLISYQDFKEKHEDSKENKPIEVVNALIKELENLHLLMNVDEHILEFIDDWFGKMKNLNILYLGRWKALMTHHIEVEDPKFFEKLGSLKYVKFLSLQGVSNIIELHKSILELTNLEVLDLRACANLERIPEKIEKLKKLKQLDMSECFLLEHMPKGLASLTNLKVLKGFFVSKEEGGYHKGCKIGDLQNLKFLEKLCIYTDWKDFPKEEYVKEMEKLKPLKKLTITWGVGTDKAKKEEEEERAKKEKELKAKKEKEEKAKKGEEEEKKEEEEKPKNEEEEEEKAKKEEEEEGKAKKEEEEEKAKKEEEEKAKKEEEDKDEPLGSAKLPPYLEKLDLKCFPKKQTPNWLMVENLKNLEKLYIRGGKFRDLGQYQGIDSDERQYQGIDSGETEKWTKVKKLRLKYLGEIEMEWRELQGLFPNLEYLEKVRCPNLTLFPCDAKGVWNKKVDARRPARDRAEPEKQEPAAGPEPNEDGQKEQRRRWPCCQDRVCC